MAPATCVTQLGGDLGIVSVGVALAGKGLEAALATGIDIIDDPRFLISPFGLFHSRLRIDIDGVPSCS